MVNTPKTVIGTRSSSFAKTEGRRAAEILLSISPKLSPQVHANYHSLRNLPSRFDPLESLADVAALESPRMSRGLQALSLARSYVPDTQQNSSRGETGVSDVSMSDSNVRCPSLLGPKYADIYNQDGRVGIYTKKERARIIARYQAKRRRRVWKKKIRYNCRKNLADKRLRVKGRFVKLTPGEAQPQPQTGSGVFAGWNGQSKASPSPTTTTASSPSPSSTTPDEEMNPPIRFRRERSMTM